MYEVGIVLFIVFIGISYYCLFKEHHKRNEMTFSEIYPLVIEYAVICIISALLIIFGFSAVFNAYTNRDEIKEVIKELTVGLFTISVVIIHFMFWVKQHKQDLVDEEREEDEVRTSHIAEWIEIIVFVLVIIASIYNIFKYINFFNEVEKYRQIAISVLCIVSAIILLNNLNPLNIKNKIKEKFKSKK